MRSSLLNKITVRTTTTKAATRVPMSAAVAELSWPWAAALLAARAVSRSAKWARTLSKRVLLCRSSACEATLVDLCAEAAAMAGSAKLVSQRDAWDSAERARPSSAGCVDKSLSNCWSWFRLGRARAQRAARRQSCR